jgi:hypothetical protein
VLSDPDLTAKVDPDITQLANLYSALKIQEKSNVPNRLLTTGLDLDEVVDDYSFVIVKYSQLLGEIIYDIDPFVTKIFGNIYFNTQIILTDPGSQADAVHIARNHNLTIVNYDECLNKLKTYHPDSDILIAKTEGEVFDKQGGLFTNITVDYYDLKSRGVMDKSTCRSEKAIVKVPVTFSKEEKTRYNRLSGKGIDIFNSNDPAFRTRCVSFIDPESEYDTTLDWRTQNYFTNRTECASNSCTYDSVNLDGYINCNCGLIKKSNEKRLEVNSLFECAGRVIVNK